MAVGDAAQALKGRYAWRSLSATELKLRKGGLHNEKS